MRSTPPLTRIATATGLSGLLLLAGAAGAQAHVRVTPSSTEGGGFSVLTFRAPTERPDAGTVKITVTLPQDHPLTSVSVRPLPGWTISTKEAALPKPVIEDGATITKAVRTVTWTAQKGQQIGPNEFQQFSISVGPLPQAGTTVRFPVDQTYSSGEIVHWNQATKDGKEPQNPAPELVVTAAAAASPGTASAPPSASPAAGSAPAAAADPGSGDEGNNSDATARWLGGGGLLAGLIGIGVGITGRRAKGTNGAKDATGTVQR